MKEVTKEFLIIRKFVLFFSKCVYFIFQETSFYTRRVSFFYPCRIERYWFRIKFSNTLCYHFPWKYVCLRHLQFPESSLKISTQFVIQTLFSKKQVHMRKVYAQTHQLVLFYFDILYHLFVIKDEEKRKYTKTNRKGVKKLFIWKELIF